MSVLSVKVDYEDRPEEVAWQFAKIIKQLGHKVGIAQKGEPQMTFEVEAADDHDFNVWYEYTPLEMVELFTEMLKPFGVKVVNLTEDDRYGLRFKLSRDQSCGTQSS
jgi:hypothetical protein